MTKFVNCGRFCIIRNRLLYCKCKERIVHTLYPIVLLYKKLLVCNSSNPSFLAATDTETS